ncbi:hypothetical protein SteCoe_19322 [Stentor coeruleus]|uniref:RBR-type E3 ubiquitin transferase n=1 Tax=Stentor coeruleus TaxID=5963 RepID=A0A1R2BUB9_9CILI|nr:hypothetical protein SteCoe_19322 [Stentor coeruleus]
MIYDIIHSEGACPICQENKDLLTLVCTHQFCKSCIETYITLKIKEADVRVITCPQCVNVLSSSEISTLVLPNIYKKYVHFKSIKDLEVDRYVKWCPIPGCDGYDVASNDNFNLICKVCNHKYCYHCSQPLHKGKCKIKEDKTFIKWAARENIRICPKCKSYVQKGGGCPHMKCTKCLYEWCWICGKEFYSINHNAFTCYVGKSFYEFYWYTIIFFILFPLCIPFWLFTYIVYKIEIADDFFMESNKIKRFKFCLYPILLALSPVGFIAVPIIPFVLFGSIFYKIYKRIRIKNKIVKFFICAIPVLIATTVILGLMISGLVIGAGLGVVFLPPLGVIMLIIKLLLSFYRCFKPQEFSYPRSLTY